MNRVLVLYGGEVVRMRKYGITAASLATAVIWVLVLQFSGLANINSIFPLVMFIDATMMSLLLVGVTMIFERQEHALKSMLVLPISKDEYLVAKTMAVVSSSLLTLILVLGYGILFKDLTINIPGIVGAVLLIAFSFSQVGIVMTYYAKDFTDLIMGMFKITILFSTPTLLENFGILKADWIRTVQYLNPTKNAMVLLQASTLPVEAKDITIAVVYMLVLGVGLYVGSRRMFDGYAAKGGGA